MFLGKKKNIYKNLIFVLFNGRCNLKINFFIYFWLQKKTQLSTKLITKKFCRA